MLAANPDDFASLAMLLDAAAGGQDGPRGSAVFSSATLRSMVERDDIVLRLSPKAVLDGVPVGIALLGERPARAAERAAGGPLLQGWLGALAVAPSAQHGGVGHRLMHGVMDTAHARHWGKITLHVAEDNVPARSLYTAHGFVAHRRLYGFALPRPTVLVESQHAVVLQPVLAPLAIALYDRCTAGEPVGARAPWPVAVPSLARLAPPSVVYQVVERGLSGAGGQTVGYVALGQGEAGPALLALGIVPEARRRGLGRAALAAAHALHAADGVLRVATLVPEASSLALFLAAQGGRPTGTTLIEMAWQDGPERVIP